MCARQKSNVLQPLMLDETGYAKTARVRNRRTAQGGYFTDARTDAHAIGAPLRVPCHPAGKFLPDASALFVTSYHQALDFIAPDQLFMMVEELFRLTVLLPCVSHPSANHVRLPAIPFQRKSDLTGNTGYSKTH
jgi:hypothetical protein